MPGIPDLSLGFTEIETFKIWRHYFERCKFEVFILINYNDLHQFIYSKRLSFSQVQWAQELSCYYFRIDYYQGKVTVAADALFCFP